MTILYDKLDSIKVGRHTFKVHTNERHWQGDPAGKMEDMPGNFLEQIVKLNACENPSPIEQLGVQYQVVLYKCKKETTSEPSSYAPLKHQQLLDLVQKSPMQYTRNIQRAVKEKL
jgi:hypothetical protein